MDRRRLGGVDGGRRGRGACAADASRRWFLADGTTQLEEEAYTIVTNPFSRSAVLDVVLYTADQAPVRHSELTGLLLPARRSLAIT